MYVWGNKIESYFKAQSKRRYMRSSWRTIENKNILSMCIFYEFSQTCPIYKSIFIEETGKSLVSEFKVLKTGRKSVCRIIRDS